MVTEMAMTWVPPCRARLYLVRLADRSPVWHLHLERGLHLPEAFARVLEISQRPSIRLHMKGCCNGDMWVNTGFPAPYIAICG